VRVMRVHGDIACCRYVEPECADIPLKLLRPINLDQLKRSER